MPLRVKLSVAVLLAALSVVLRVGVALAQVSAQDCAALEVALTGSDGSTDLDLVARDNLARRIERHGAALGLTPSTARLQALALRDDDPALMALLMADMPALEAAHALCLDSVADQDTSEAGASDAQQGDSAGPIRAGPPRHTRAVIRDGAVSFSWGALLGLPAAILGMALGVWGFTFIEKRRRRRGRRYVCDLPARATIEGDGAVAVRVTDISRLGCRLTPGAALGQPGARVGLLVAGLELPGRIVWQNRHFCGLVFAAPVAQAEIDFLLAKDREVGTGELFPA